MKCVILFALAVVATAKTVTLSNVKLPVDQFGEKLITGEADVLVHEGAYYLYFNNWGTCPGVNCCDSQGGCADCCFDNPPHPYAPGCGDLKNGSDPYGLYHTVQAYQTTDFTTFTNLGVALTMDARLPGTEFRPHVVYNPKSKLFVMWYEDRGANEQGYAVAVSPNPGGPFQTAHTNVTLPGRGRVGDFDIFVDDDGSAYHVRTGFDIVKLNDDFTGGAAHVSNFTTPKESEGPVMFKRGGKYYILTGTGCCACTGGATVYVDVADTLAGPWTFAGDVGSNPTPFDPHSPNNFVTKAQASAAFGVPDSSSPTGGSSIVWMGNQWNSGLDETPPGPRNHDLLYWAVLDFNADGTVKQLQYKTEVELKM
jgi:hypothetical protein